MTRRSQDPALESTGRVNQKRRTRMAIVDAARAILERGDTPTVAQAAEAALVSRTTAYRYFPTQESLLLELSVTASVDEIEEFLARPRDDTPQDRLFELVDMFNSYCADHEVLMRTAERHYMDTWLAAERTGAGHEQPVREGRRRQWIATALEPAVSSLPDAERQRLEAALCLVIGVEAFTVMRDVCQLDSAEAIAVLHWAAQAILAAALPT